MARHEKKAGHSYFFDDDLIFKKAALVVHELEKVELFGFENLEDIPYPTDDEVSQRERNNQ